MLECVRPDSRARPPRLFDVGCALGYVVMEAQRRGWEAGGIDLSPEVVAASPVRNRLRVGDATRDPIDDCDVAVCLNVFEHLTPRDALCLAENMRTHAAAALTVINKSDHDPTHVSLNPNRWWIRLLHVAGLHYDRGTTYACRAAYLRSGNWYERWWRDCLVFRSAPSAIEPSLWRSAADFSETFAISAARRIMARPAEIRATHGRPAGRDPSSH